MRKFGVPVALVAALFALPAGLAGAAPAGKLDTQIIGNVRIDPSDPTVAYVTVSFIAV